MFVNALHITLGGDLLNEDDGTSGGETTTTLVDGVTVPDVGTNSFEAQQLGGGDGGGEDALLDIILGHAEVGGTVCAEQARPPAPPSPPAGDDRTLPVTGGGLGFLPAVLGLGLAGGAVAAGRVALRSRREHTL